MQVTGRAYSGTKTKTELWRQQEELESRRSLIPGNLNCSANKISVTETAPMLMSEFKSAFAACTPAAPCLPSPLHRPVTSTRI